MPTASANPTLTVYQRLWTIVLAWTPLTQVVSPRSVPLLKSGNVERYDLAAVAFPAQKPRKAPADSVTFNLEIGGGRQDPRAARTLCLQPNVDAVDFTWTLIAADKRIIDLTQAEAELRAAMAAAGVQLGITSTVARWEWATRPGRVVPDSRSTIVTQTVYVKS